MMDGSEKPIIKEKRMSREVEKYIEKQKSPQKEIVQKLRMLILKTLPDISEELKWVCLGMKANIT